MSAKQSRQQEFNRKLKRIRSWLRKEKVGGVLLTGRGFFGWATAGGDNHVVFGSEDGSSSFLVTDKETLYVTNNIEKPRLEAEEFAGLRGIKTLSFPWHDEGHVAGELKKRVGKKSLVGDVGKYGAKSLPNTFQPMTWQMEPNEIVRYRKLGCDCAAALETAVSQAKPGQSETEIGALIAGRMFDLNITPALVLVATDDRIKKFRHPTPQHRKKLKRHLMGVLCGRRGGLIVSVTRLCWFGDSLPKDLQRRHKAVLDIDVTLNAGSTPGRVVGDIFREAQGVFAEHGFADEWKLHHQGGPTGYQGRSYKGTPNESRKVLPNQAFAWNPSITGTKNEDTVLAGSTKGADIEFLSKPGKLWPCLTVIRNGKKYRRADIKLL